MMGRRSYMVAGRGRALGLALTASLLFMMLGAASAEAAPGPPALLIGPPAESGQAAAADAIPWRPGVLRQRTAAVSLDVLVRADGTPAAGVGQQIALDLFGDAKIVMTIGDVTRNSARSHTWSGTLDGVDYGYAALVLRDGALVGQVVVPPAIYRIRYAPDGTQVVQQVDQAALPRESDPIVPRLSTAGQDLKVGADVTADTASQIDVMVLYTPAARAGAGGVLAMQAEVDLAIALANQAYANNALVQRLRPVFVGEIAMTENTGSSSFNLDLDALESNPTVAWLRDVSRADIVSLITDHGPTSPFCGLGYLMIGNSTGFAPFAFSIVERECASALLTFAHELGHNMGAHHDPFVSVGEPTMFPYSHGFVDLVGKFRTIMAYNDQCAFTGFNCPRILGFSSPNFTFNGRPIGTALASDNSRTLSQTANTVANLRHSLVGPPTAFTGVNQSAFSVGDTLSVSVGLENSGRTGVADIYFGLLAPDGGVAFFTGTPVTASDGFAFGNVLNYATYRPIATGVPLATPFSVNIPGFLSYPWTGGEPRGGYVLFLLVTTTNALADGVLASNELLGASLTPFSFPPAGQADGP